MDVRAEIGICRKGKMVIRDFEPKHTEEAAEIALDVYNYERAFTQELPEVSSIPILKQLSGNGFGVAAFEGGKMVGFLCSVEPFENVFRSTDVRGVFSPMGANGAVMENHGKIYAALYQAATAAAKSFQSCPSLCDPMDGSPPGPAVPGVL